MASRQFLGGAAAARRVALAALVALVVFLAWTAWRGAAETTPAPPSAAPPAHAAAGPGVAPVAALQPPGPAVRPAPTPPAADADTPPEGLSAEQWRELRATLADHPQREAETARIVAYLQFAARWQQFVERRSAGAGVAELKPIALALDQGLEARVRQRELGGAEARNVKSALLAVLEPDAAARERRLRDWLAGIEAAQRGAPASQAAQAAQQAAEDAQGREFARRQAEIVAAWRALPPERRDAAQLEADLEALRRSVFIDPTREGDKR